MGYTIYFPTPIGEVDAVCDNVDVCVGLDDGREYTLVVATPDGIKAMMKNEGVPYIRPSVPFLVVEEITEENIRRLVEELLDEGEIFLEVYGGDLMMSSAW